MKLRPPHSTIVDAASANHAPWLTMVHAASHDQRFFSSQVRAFESDFRLLLVDLPGHGKSAAAPGPYGFEEYTASVQAAMDAAGIEKTHFLGTHTGAAVGLMLADRDPARVLSLALESVPLPGADLPSVRAAYARACATARSHGVEAARSEWLEQGPWFEIIRKHPARCRADAHRAMLSDFSGRPWLDDAPAKPVQSLMERLTFIRCAVLIFNGAHDPADFLRAADALQRRLPNVERLMVEGAGGFPMWEDPDSVNPRIRAHLLSAAEK